MFYSGDTDGYVPTAGSKRWIQELDMDILEDKRMWYSNDQVAGFITKYDGLDFATVKGVGNIAVYQAK